jgi:hypothetical protein
MVLADLLCLNADGACASPDDMDKQHCGQSVN